MKKLLEILRKGLTDQISALASATGKAADDLRANLQAQLVTVGELDKLPETDANAAYVAMMTKQAEHATLLFANLTTAQADLVKATDKVKEFDGKIASGELITKAVLTEKCQLAETKGVESCAPEIAELRKKSIAGLPDVPDNILKLPTAEFASLVTDARENLKTGEGKGLKPDGKGSAFIKRAIWQKKDTFATELASLEKDGFLKGGPVADPAQQQEADKGVEAADEKVGMC